MTSENLSSKTENEMTNTPMDIENKIKPKKNGFGLSKMWMGTLLRRDGILAFVAFMAYFSVTVLPMLLFRTSPTDLYSYIETTITSEFSVTSFISLIYAVSLPVLTFDYLHSSASCSELHSFPLTRGKLFRTSLAVELILIIIPIVLTGIGICLVGNTVMSYKIGSLTTPVNCLKWMIDTIVGSLFVLSLSNLAGVIAGKNIIHALLAYLLNGILSIICFLIETYVNSFILGATSTGLTSFLIKLNPFLWYTSERTGILSLKDAPMMLLYVGITIAVTVFTGLLYKKIKLEREGDATVFPVVSDLLVIFLTFCVMSMFGFMLASMQPGLHATMPVGPFLTGCLIAGPVSFIVFRMIAESSVRIFNVRALINFMALLLVSAVIFALTCFDITGQASKVPYAKDVKRVSITAMEPFYNSTTVVLSDAESIKNVTALHEAIVNHKDEFDTSAENGTYTMDFTMDYVLSDGSTFTRHYMIDTGKHFDDIDAAVDTISKGDEYIEKLDHYMRKLILSNKRVELWPGSSAEEIPVKKDDVRPLLMAYLEDCRENGAGYYRELMNKRNDSELSFTKDGYATIEISAKLDGSGIYEQEDQSFSLIIGPGNKHVVKFLKKHGYTDELIKAEDIDAQADVQIAEED